MTNVKQSDVAWEREPDWYDSSPIARRPYCRECGTSLGFQFKKGSEILDLTVASASTTLRRFKPIHHFGAESMHRAWLNTEGLPEKRTEDYQKLVDKWVEGDREVPWVSEVTNPTGGRRRMASGWRGARWGRDWPAILLHGLFSDANMNWIKFGHAARIASEGFRVIMPDLRAHGLDHSPHDPAASYPRGILARDVKELRRHPGCLTLFDLGGFSLGARTTSRKRWAKGLRQACAILGGSGLDGLRDWRRRKDFFVGAIDRFDTASAGRSLLAFHPVHEEPRGRSCYRGIACCSTVSRMRSWTG